jgi:GntR family transcriptional repressor for pyruvate dehydrogenase complex
MASADIDNAAGSPYEQFCRFIVERRLQPGDRVPSIRDLARRFGLGVVAVRDALVQAEREGLIEIRPRAGAFIRSLEGRLPVPADEFCVRVVDGRQLHLCHARELLEVEIAGQAALRCRPADLLPIREALESWHRANSGDDDRLIVESDCRFHVGIARMGGNPVVADILDQCLRQQYMLECSLPETPDDTRSIAAIHNNIYEALRDRDADRARAEMRRHMKYLESNIQKILLTTPGPDGAKEKRPKTRARLES